MTRLLESSIVLAAAEALLFYLLRANLGVITTRFGVSAAKEQHEAGRSNLRLARDEMIFERTYYLIKRL
jgi:hypothetical protein